MDNPNGTVNPEWYANMVLDKLPQMGEVDEDNNAVEDARRLKMERLKSMDYFRNYDAEQGTIRSTHYNDTSMLKVPVLGRIHYVFDIQGFMQIGFIVFYWIYGTSTSMFVVLIPMYNDGKVPFPLLLCKCTVTVPSYSFNAVECVKLLC